MYLPEWIVLQYTICSSSSCSHQLSKEWHQTQAFNTRRLYDLNNLRDFHWRKHKTLRNNLLIKTIFLLNANSLGSFYLFVHGGSGNNRCVLHREFYQVSQLTDSWRNLIFWYRGGGICLPCLILAITLQGLMFPVVRSFIALFCLLNRDNK